MRRPEKPLSLFLWLSKLDDWTELSKTVSRDNATRTVFMEDMDARAWCKTGFEWMDSIPSNVEHTRQLHDCIQNNSINPMDVLSKLSAQAFQHQYYDPELQMDRGGFLDYMWSWAVGCTMLMNRMELDNVKSKSFVRSGLDLFRENFHPKVVGEEHLTWVQSMCEEHTWFREAVVEWLLDGQAAEKPVWAWAFHGNLLQSPSSEFVAAMMVCMDRHKEFYGVEGLPTVMVQKFQEQVRSLQHSAPDVYHGLEAAHNTYTSLYGAPASPNHTAVMEHRTPTVMPLLSPCLDHVGLDMGELLDSSPGVV